MAKYKKLGGCMLKKIFGVIVCLSIISVFSPVNAHEGGFTWFGLRRDNTEVVFSTSSHEPECHPPGHCHKPKPKPKHKHKPKPKPKPKKHHHDEG